MKYIKILGFAAVVAAALMALGVSTASATTLADGSGNHPTEVVETSTAFTLQGPAGIHTECGHSLRKWTITDDGTISGTVQGTVNSFTITGCEPWTVTVLDGGTLSITGDVVRSTGAEITMLRNDGIHCVYTTNHTIVGTLTESSGTGGTAVLDISGTIPRTGGKSGVYCGTTGQWSGKYDITSPDVLNIDWVSGTTLTDGSGNHPTEIDATSTVQTLQGAAGIHIVCKHSGVEGTVTDDGTGDGTVNGTIDSLTFSECAPWTVTVLKPGTLSISGDVVKSSGAEVTALRNDGIHCLYTTNDTIVGTLTESSETGGTAVLDLNGVIPRTAGKSGIFCGATGAWKGNYKITSPDVLNID